MPLFDDLRKKVQDINDKYEAQPDDIKHQQMSDASGLGILGAMDNPETTVAEGANIVGKIGEMKVPQMVEAAAKANPISLSKIRALMSGAEEAAPVVGKVTSAVEKDPAMLEQMLSTVKETYPSPEGMAAAQEAISTGDKIANLGSKAEQVASKPKIFGSTASKALQRAKAGMTEVGIGTEAAAKQKALAQKLFEADQAVPSLESGAERLVGSPEEKTQMFQALKKRFGY